MSKPASKTLIGAFVAGAIALGVIGIVIFGSGKFFTKKMTCVMFFEGSVAGLNVGAPVVFRGVKVGYVSRIEVDFDSKDLSFVIPVYIDLEPEKVTSSRTPLPPAEKERIAELLIEKGLKAQLELQSMVTGQLMINLDFVPDKPAKLVGLDKKHPEIPTIPSGLEEFLKAAQEIPLQELSKQLLGAVEGINKVVNSPKLAASLDSLSEGLQEARKILTKIDREVDPVLTNIAETSVSVREIFKRGENVPGQVEEALKAARNALAQADKTLSSVQDLTSANSSLVTEFRQTLEEFENTARSFRFFTDYLQRHPDSLLWGKPANKGD
jgi:paraquat-inducible protein B